MTHSIRTAALSLWLAAGLLGCSDYFGKGQAPRESAGAVMGLLGVDTAVGTGSTGYIGSVALGADAAYAVVVNSNGSSAWSIWSAPRDPTAPGNPGASLFQTGDSLPGGGGVGGAARVAVDGDTVYWLEPPFGSKMGVSGPPPCPLRARPATGGNYRGVATIPTSPSGGSCAPLGLVAAGGDVFAASNDGTGGFDPFNPAYGKGSQSFNGTQPAVLGGIVRVVASDGTQTPIVTGRAIVTWLDAPLLVDADRVYWLEDTVAPNTSKRNGGALAAVPRGGGAVQPLLAFSNDEWPFGLAQDGTFVYAAASITQSGTGGGPGGCTIRRVRKDGGAEEEIARDPEVRCTGLAVSGTDLYVTEQTGSSQSGPAALTLVRLPTSGGPKSEIRLGREDLYLRSVLADHGPRIVLVDSGRLLGVDKSVFP
jgi:hypothetical protein